jgi:hypothetical protein
MDNKILLICPSRNRSHKIDEFYKNFVENSTITDLVFSLDKDDEHNYPRYDAPNVFYEIGFGGGISPAINYVAYKYAQNPQYKLIGMVNDDHKIQTYAWDQIMYDKVKDLEYVIAHPNDLRKEMEYTFDWASSVFMTRNIINVLGYMAEPGFNHLYVDTIWLDLAKQLNCLEYFKDVIFEHIHPLFGKAKMDDDYADYYISEKAKKLELIDRSLYYHYIKNSFTHDVQKIHFIAELMEKQKEFKNEK